MSSNYFRGRAPAIQQVATIVITAGDATTTYKIHVGGQTASFTGDADEGIIADGLADAWNNLDHPHTNAVTATSNSVDTITLFADTDGVPFVVTTSVTGGAGTIGSPTNTAANAGPNDWSTALNWDGAAVPVSSDTTRLSDITVPILWGLDQSAVTLTRLEIEQSVLAPIGLDGDVFQTSASASDDTDVEYRDDYLRISATTLIIGDHHGTGSPAGSPRIKIDTGTDPCTCVVKNTGTPSETNKRPVRLLFDDAASQLIVHKGGVAVAADKPGETSTLSEINAYGGAVQIGAGVTLTNLYALGGDHSLGAGATLVHIEEGTVELFGAGNYTTVTMHGGTITNNSTGTVTTLNVQEGATYNHLRDGTITTLNLAGILDLSDGEGTVTITTLNITSKEAQVLDPNGRLADDTVFVPAAGVNLRDVVINLGPGEKLKKVA